jgi:hypothetical protein
MKILKINSSYYSFGAFDIIKLSKDNWYLYESQTGNKLGAYHSPYLAIKHIKKEMLYEG